MLKLKRKTDCANLRESDSWITNSHWMLRKARIQKIPDVPTSSMDESSFQGIVDRVKWPELKWLDVLPLRYNDYRILRALDGTLILINEKYHRMIQDAEDTVYYWGVDDRNTIWLSFDPDAHQYDIRTLTSTTRWAA
jgi:hypothetical protein